jgi:hypothetical protein
LIGIVCLISPGKRIERSWSDLRFAFFDKNQVPNLGKHAARRRRIGNLNGLVDPPQPKGGDGIALIGRPSDNAAYQRHLNDGRLL